MRTTIVFPVLHFRSALRELRRPGRQAVMLPLGANRVGEETRWLVRAPSAAPPSAARDMPALLLSSVAEVPEAKTMATAMDASRASVHLALGAGPVEGRLWGIAQPPGPKAIYQGDNPGRSVAPRPLSLVSVNEVFLPGPGMYRLRVEVPSCIGGLIPSAEGPMETWAVTPPESPEGFTALRTPQSQGNLERWSRTIGALGIQVWQRLTSLHVAVVGCGRTGSLVATTLARMGVRWLTLMDGDRVEEHNLGEMNGVTEADIGKPKAEALAAHLLDHVAAGGTSIVAVSKPCAAARAEALSADVLIVCVDNDDARLECAIFGALHHEVLLDIGTGIHSGMTNDQAPNDQLRNSQFELRNRAIGADLRLILPGDGCLLCLGNLGDYEGAVRNLLGGRNPSEVSGRPLEWWEQRNGSLRTLNMMAAGMAVQMLCDLVAERVQTSTWVQVRFEADGATSLGRTRRNSQRAENRCALCLRAGMGQNGLLGQSKGG